MTKGYIVKINGKPAGDLWKKHGCWHWWQHSRGVWVSRRNATLENVKQHISALWKSEEVELERVYW